MWICRFVDCNLYFNIKGRNYNKLLIRQPQENIPHSMFQQDCAPLHFHNEVGMTTLLFFFSWIRCGGCKNWHPRSPDLFQKGFFFVGSSDDNIYVRPVPTTYNTWSADKDQRGLCKNDSQILRNMWQEVQYPFHNSRSTFGVCNKLC